MSTKALWAALRRLSDLEAEKSGTTLTTLAHNAGQELEAIERAAKAVTNPDTEEADLSKYEPAMRRYLDGMDLLTKIAEDAP